MVFLKSFFFKVDFEKNPQHTITKHAHFPSMRIDKQSCVDIQLMRRCSHLAYESTEVDRYNHDKTNHMPNQRSILDHPTLYIDQI